jgi:hypothetical protein
MHMMIDRDNPNYSSGPGFCMPSSRLSSDPGFFKELIMKSRTKFFLIIIFSIFLILLDFLWLWLILMLAGAAWHFFHGCRQYRDMHKELKSIKKGKSS